MIDNIDVLRSIMVDRVLREREGSRIVVIDSSRFHRLVIVLSQEAIVVAI